MNHIVTHSPPTEPTSVPELLTMLHPNPYQNYMAACASISPKIMDIMTIGRTEDMKNANSDWIDFGDKSDNIEWGRKRLKR